MRKTRFYTALTLVIMLLTASCVSTGGNTVTYYVLDPVNSSMTKPGSMRIGVGPVDIPEYLDRPHLMTRSGASSLQANKNHRWAAPLESIITDSIKQNLAIRLPNADISSYPWDAKRRVDRQYIISINQFIASATTVELNGRWRLFNRNGKQLMSKPFSYQVPLSGSSEADVVNGMATAVGHLGDDIVKQVP